MCTKQVIDGPAVLGWVAGVLGIVILITNGVVMYSVISKVRKITKTRKAVNEIMILTIAIGDLIVGLYLIVIFGYNIHYKYFADPQYYCKNRYDWLTSAPCSIIGAANTFGTQISLFAMTLLSVIRVVTVKKLHGSSDFNINRKISLAVKILGIVIVSAIISTLPLIGPMEDYFVNGIHYNYNPLFVGAPDRRQHIAIIEAYHGSFISTTVDTSWNTITSFIRDMFTNDYNSEVLGRSLNFYGNEGVCLFKYFVDKHDPQKYFTWGVLGGNMVCFLVILMCYCCVYTRSHKVSAGVQGATNKNNTSNRLQFKISIIILTDFLCWVPFIVVCILHHEKVIDGETLYPYSSILILPINSLLNPLLYSPILADKLYSVYNSAASKWFTRWQKKRSGTAKTPVIPNMSCRDS
jgi:hypothetical protein